MSTWWAPRSSKPLSVSDPHRGWFDSFPLRHFFHKWLTLSEIQSAPKSTRSAEEYEECLTVC